MATWGSKFCERVDPQFAPQAAAGTYRQRRRRRAGRAYVYGNTRCRHRRRLSRSQWPRRRTDGPAARRGRPAGGVLMPARPVLLTPDGCTRRPPRQRVREIGAHLWRQRRRTSRLFLWAPKCPYCPCWPCWRPALPPGPLARPARPACGPAREGKLWRSCTLTATRNAGGHRLRRPCGRGPPPPLLGETGPAIVCPWQETRR